MPSAVASRAWLASFTLVLGLLLGACARQSSSGTEAGGSSADAAPKAAAKPSNQGAQASGRPFYEGKTIRMIVGLSAGGGYDTYTRMLARHFAKYVPGNPNIVVENMVGASGLIAANNVYKV